MATRIHELGEGIISSHAGFAEPFISYRGQVFRRFMNVLAVPCALDELSRRQIAVINRFRESFINSHTNPQAERSRAFFERVISELETQLMFEIGPGKFPIDVDRERCSTVYLEIDEEARLYLTAKSLDVRETVDDAWIAATRQIDAVVGVHVLHFDVNPTILEPLIATFTPSGYALFNFIEGNTASPLNVMKAMSGGGLRLAVFKPTWSSGHEWFFVASRDTRALERILHIASEA